MTARTHNSITVLVDFSGFATNLEDLESKFPRYTELHYLPTVKILDNLGFFIAHQSTKDQALPCYIVDFKCQITVDSLLPGRMYNVELSPVNSVNGPLDEETSTAISTFETHSSCSCSSDGSGTPKPLPPKGYGSPESNIDIVQKNGRISLKFIEDSGKYCLFSVYLVYLTLTP